VAWELWDGKTTIALFGRNLLDRRYIAGALDLRSITGTNQAFFAPPRTYGVEIIRTFGN
jgi:outer membrane receptor protein involved in Fe transport